MTLTKTSSMQAQKEFALCTHASKFIFFYNIFLLWAY